MKNLLYTIILGVFITFQANAQSQYSLSYSIGFPMGDLGDFISPVSWRGVCFDYQGMVTENIAIGFSTGWNVFYEERAYDSYTVENITVSGKQYRYSNHLPILFTAGYYFDESNTLDPFVRLGIGTIYTVRELQMGQFESEEEAWNFALTPEVGVKYNFPYNDKAIFISAQYFQGFQAGNELDEPQSYLALKIGFEL